MTETTAEVERLQAERDDCLYRLRQVEGAYSRLDAQKRDLEGVRDRWKARAEQAEATIERVRALHKQFREDIPVCDYCDEDYPCATIRALEHRFEQNPEATQVRVCVCVRHVA